MELAPVGKSALELNNNDSCQLDVFSLLHLKDEPLLHSSSEQISHASSLESLQPCQGSSSPTPSLSGSTSCSESSFEMASSCSFSEEDLQPHIRSSISYDSLKPTTIRRYHVRESIDKELSQLDTGLPDLDFTKLEEKLSAAAKEQEKLDRSRLGEEVRRRLALQVDALADSCPVVAKRPFKSNLGQRLQAAINLQVCYMNELSEDSETEDDDDEEDDDFLGPSIRPSKSVPDLNAAAVRARRLRKEAAAGRKLSPDEKQDLLQTETVAVQAAAAAKGRKTIEELRAERKSRPGRRRYSRQMLSRMTNASIAEILENVEDSIEATNTQLVSVLQVRDSLHMERDSLLVDIDDLVDGSQSAQLDIRTLISLQDSNPDVPPDLSTPT